MRRTSRVNLLRRRRLCVGVLAVTAIAGISAISHAQSVDSEGVTFAKDIAPIFQQKCQEKKRDS